MFLYKDLGGMVLLEFNHFKYIVFIEGNNYLYML